MKQVIIAFDKKGEPYVKYCPKKVEVIFKQPKKRPLIKRIKTLIYRIGAGE